MVKPESRREAGVGPKLEGETIVDEKGVVVDEKTFRQAMGYFATGVTVITAAYEGEPVGITANAVTSVSLNPTLLLVCVNTRLFTHEAVGKTGRFAVNVLGADQERLARHFASSMPDKFSGVPFRWACGVPVLGDAIAHFACNVHERYPGGDTHSVFIGRVVECGHVPDRQPLLYFGSKFGRIDDPHTQLLHAISHSL